MSSNDPANLPMVASPSSSGPAGALFEGQVAAHYLLTLLAESEPRGFPGVLIERIELQRAGEGHPLDDVIVRGTTRDGEPAVLEVQVKRTITFSPSDPVFRGVVEQLARALTTLDLSKQLHRFAVATERTSFKIAGAYQDVLRWARDVGSASVFFDRINRKNVGNADMRTFVETVRTHLEAAGCAHDDETVWQLLRRFHILPFDYDAPGSQSLELALERTRNLLEPADAPRATAFWKVLTETAIRNAAAGGDLDQARLLGELAGVDSFRLLGSRQNRAARDALAQAATLAAADLRGSIAGATLARTVQLEAVREARESARYIEIRGSSGVGKSGLLGILVDQVLSEGHAIVLSPERTIPGGWIAFKAALQIAVGPEAFLSDLASGGGAVLFIDSLDFFDNHDKRATVIDLMRAALSVPNFQIIVTARTDFDKDEPNWLPGDLLAKLGRAHPILIDELGVEEVEELKAAAPGLRALLADDHPARAMARNLFRLSRLMEIEGTARQLRSEIDLLERWWTTADGSLDGRRERARLIAAVADVALAGGTHLTTTSSAIDALIASGTLRELGLDRISFRHDVLRDWGVAARLHDDPSKIAQLPLDRPAPPSLARGIELGARFALERSEDGRAWIDYVQQLSPAGAHASWRRWSLLAILRSEITLALLDRAAEILFENEGVLLRELIRTAIAVESRPLADMLAGLGVDKASIPTGMFGPANGSWGKLVHWLVARRADLPLRALPDVVELFQSFSTSTFLLAPITPHVAGALADWLEEIEDAREHPPLEADRPRFQDVFRYSNLRGLETDVRQAFLLVARRVPERAKGYLRKLLSRRNPDQTIQEIMRFRGTLAQAAPAELVELTLAGLIPRNSKRRRRTTDRDETFSYANSNFLPSSPTQGPFLDLLNASPEHGLALIRQLVGHAIAIRTQRSEPDDDAFTLALPTGSRRFPWQRSYFWSRQADGAYSVECALMALEAWSHARIERGDSAEQVIADILGPEGSPAAFLLVAVDIVISHWPKTKTVAVPFVGSPELLSIDRNRQLHDAMPAIDLGGLGMIGPKEPLGPVRLADLKKRPSRSSALERLLPGFTFDTTGGRSTVQTLLADASTRLGQPLSTDTFAEPKFMARHGLNLIDPGNWHQQEGGYVYASPPEEAQHVAALQAEQARRTLDLGVDAAIQNALEDSSRSNQDLAEQAVIYAQRLESQSDTPEDVLRSRSNAIVSAAMILVRDGSDALLDQHEGWARDIFAQAFADKHDAVGAYLREGIRFNPVAIAALGLIHLWRRRRCGADRDALFELVGRDMPDAAQGFGAGLSVLRDTNAHLAPSLLRCALVAQIRPTHHWDDPDDKRERDCSEHRARIARAIAAEIAWLNGSATEPTWPVLPARVIAIRHGARISVGGDEHDDRPTPPAQPEVELRSQTAALWVRQLSRGDDPVDLKWILNLVDAYAQWTAAANGAGLDAQIELDGRTDEWNTTFLRLLGRALPHMEADKAIAHVIQAIAVPDEAFFDLTHALVRAIDTAHFKDAGLDLGVALRLRSLVADRLMKTSGWRHERDRTELSVESHIGPAIAALFFNEYTAYSGTSCYLLANGIDRVTPFLPGLTRLIEDGSVQFTALLTMDLLEVSPRSEHAPFLLSSASTWLRRQPTNTRLWVDSGIGARLANWLASLFKADVALHSPSHPLRSQIEDVLACLVRAGVAEAHRVEQLVASALAPGAIEV